MQTKEQMKNWKVVASVATVAALGISGLAVASPGEPAEAPPPIEIEDRRGVITEFTTTTVAPAFEVVPGRALSPDHTLDSPLASADLASADLASADLDSPATTAPATVDDSPDVNDSPAPAPAPTVDDSPDASADSPEASVDSPDSGDSLDT